MVNLDKTIILQPRDTVRKGLNKIRNEGTVPAVIHNHGQPSIHVMGSASELSAIYKEAGKHHPLQLKVDDQDFLALIKDAHYNPVKKSIQHYVFQAIRQNETVEAEVPIHLEGDIPAEKAGLMVLHQLDSVELEALPRNLPDQLIADASKLVEIGDKIVVGDLSVPEGVTILTEVDHPIATVVETRAQISEEETAEESAEAEEAAEGAAQQGDETEKPAES